MLLAFGDGAVAPPEARRLEKPAARKATVYLGRREVIRHKAKARDLAR